MKLQLLKGVHVNPASQNGPRTDHLAGLCDETAARLGITRGVLIRAAVREFCDHYAIGLQREVLGRHFTEASVETPQE